MNAVPDEQATTVEVADMDGPGLSSRERQILAQIETALGRDRRLARRLVTFRPAFPARCLRAAEQAGGRLRGWAFALLAAVSVVLLAAAVRTTSPTLAAVSAATWAVTMVLGVWAWRARRRRRH